MIQIIKLFGNETEGVGPGCTEGEMIRRKRVDCLSLLLLQASSTFNVPEYIPVTPGVVDDEINYIFHGRGSILEPLIIFKYYPEIGFKF